MIQNAETITEYRIPANKAEIKQQEENYVIRVQDRELLQQEEQNPELPDTVNCPECKTKTAEQDRDDQLYICTSCGTETVTLQ